MLCLSVFELYSRWVPLLHVCLSVLVAFKTTKVDISCIITCDSGLYCSNFITCIRIYNAKKKNHDHAKY